MTRAGLKRAVITATLHTAQVTACPQTTSQGAVDYRIPNCTCGNAILPVCVNTNHSSITDTEAWAVPWLRRLGTGLSLQKPRFNLRPVYVESVVDKVTLGHIFHRAP